MPKGKVGRTILCSKCKKQKEIESKRYCRKCANEWMRDWRKTHPLTGLAKFKAIVRAKTKMRVRRGSLIKSPCEKCGEIKVQAHHEDYNKPYDVKWLCFPCHREHHRNI